MEFYVESYQIKCKVSIILETLHFIYRNLWAMAPVQWNFSDSSGS